MAPAAWSFRWETAAGEALRVDGAMGVPESRVLAVHLPGGGLVRRRPPAVRVGRAGRAERLTDALARGGDMGGQMTERIFAAARPGAVFGEPVQAGALRAVFGLSKIQDGGRVMTGIDEREEKLDLTGLSDEQLRTWAYDHVAHAVRPYAARCVRLDFGVVGIDGRKFVECKVVAPRAGQTAPVAAAAGTPSLPSPCPNAPAARRAS